MTTQTCGWTCIVAGIWLILAPFALGYSTVAAALWNDIILGLIVLVVGGYALSAKKKPA